MSLDRSNGAAQAWNQLIASFPDPQLLQTWHWGQFKSGYGWQPFPLIWRREGRAYQPWEPGTPSEEIDAAALVLQRTVRLGGFAASLRVQYVPKGPLLRDLDNAVLRGRVLDDLGHFARRQGAILVKIDPDVCLGTGYEGTSGAQPSVTGESWVQDLAQRGWVLSDEQIQFRNTMMIDLSQPEEALLANMKQKTRYNVRLSARKGVQVRAATEADFPTLYAMYAETSVRDGFVIRDRAYYVTLWQRFTQAGLAEGLIAEAEGEAISGAVIFRFGGTAWFMFGMSRSAQREKMPNYLLQWEAMRRATVNGCSRYDLWGAPDEFDEQDPMWGVYRFKDGLGAQVVRHIGAWDLPTKPLLYRLYTQVLPKILDWMRRRGKAHTRQQLTTNL